MAKIEKKDLVYTRVGMHSIVRDNAKILAFKEGLQLNAWVKKLITEQIKKAGGLVPRPKIPDCRSGRISIHTTPVRKQEAAEKFAREKGLSLNQGINWLLSRYLD